MEVGECRLLMGLMASLQASLSCCKVGRLDQLMMLMGLRAIIPAENSPESYQEHPGIHSNVALVPNANHYNPVLVLQQIG